MPDGAPPRAPRPTGVARIAPKEPVAPARGGPRSSSPRVRALAARVACVSVEMPPQDPDAELGADAPERPCDVTQKACEKQNASSQAETSETEPCHDSPGSCGEKPGEVTQKAEPGSSQEFLERPGDVTQKLAERTDSEAPVLNSEVEPFQQEDTSGDVIQSPGAGDTIQTPGASSSKKAAADASVKEKPVAQPSPLPQRDDRPVATPTNSSRPCPLTPRSLRSLNVADMWLRLSRIALLEIPKQAPPHRLLRNLVPEECLLVRCDGEQERRAHESMGNGQHEAGAYGPERDGEHEAGAYGPEHDGERVADACRPERTGPRDCEPSGPPFCQPSAWQMMAFPKDGLEAEAGPEVDGDRLEVATGTPFCGPSAWKLMAFPKDGLAAEPGPEADGDRPEEATGMPLPKDALEDKDVEPPSPIAKDAVVIGYSSIERMQRMIEDCEPPAAKSNRPGEDADDEGGAVDEGEDDDEEGPDWTESEARAMHGWARILYRVFSVTMAGPGPPCGHGQPEEEECDPTQVGIGPSYLPRQGQGHAHICLGDVMEESISWLELDSEDDELASPKACDMVQVVEEEEEGEPQPMPAALRDIHRQQKAPGIVAGMQKCLSF